MNIPDVFVYLSEQDCDVSAMMKDKDMVSLTTTELFSSVMFVLAVWADRNETLDDDSIDWIHFLLHSILEKKEKDFLNVY